MPREARHCMQIQGYGAKRRNKGLHTPCYTVLQSSTLCCVAARCCAVKQHVAVLRSSPRREAPESRREAPSTLRIKLHSPRYNPLADLFGVGPRDLVPRLVGLV